VPIKNFSDSVLSQVKTLKAKAHEQESTIALLYGQLDL